MALTFLRHTQPDVAKGVCYGQTDLALAPSFEADAVLALEGLPAFEAVYSSPLQRCQRLAGKVGAYEVAQGFAEMDFGAWEMVPWAEIDRAEMDAWAADFMGARPHGGESVAQLRDRVSAAIESVPDGALIVTHNGVIKAAAALAGHPEGWDISLEFGGSIQLF